MEEVGKAAFAGIDTHKDTHELALLDSVGRVIGTWQFATGVAGYADLERAIGDPSVPVGIEGAASYGAGIAAHLQACGYEVFEMIRPKKSQRRRGKSDPIDAIAAAKNLAAGEGLPLKANDGVVEDVRCLMLAREQAVRQAHAILNCIDSLVVTAPEPVRAALRNLPGEERARKLAKSRPADSRGRAFKRLAKRWVAAKADADELEAEIGELVKEAYPALIGARGVAAISAARIIVAAGSNPERMGSEAAFSMLCGTSPIPASSGKKDRHRLNRGGDRQANRGIHEIACSRMTFDERTQGFIARKIKEGKTKREAIRCLCRYIAREVYKLLCGPQEPLPDPANLVERRKALGLRQKDVVQLMSSTVAKVSRIERGEIIDGDFLRQYERFLASYSG